MFRHRPAELFFARGETSTGRDPGAGASGFWHAGTGKMRPDTSFEATDHREFNRHGETFDVGETFSGVDYRDWAEGCGSSRPFCPRVGRLPQFALRWILMRSGQSHVLSPVPGGRGQVEENVAAAEFAPLSDSTMAEIQEALRSTDTQLRSPLLVVLRSEFLDYLLHTEASKNSGRSVTWTMELLKTKE